VFVRGRGGGERGRAAISNVAVIYMNVAMTALTVL